MDSAGDLPSASAQAFAAGLSVGELFEASAALTPGAVAMQDRKGAVCYAEIAARVRRLAHALTARGVVRGDRVAILSENRREYAEALLACAMLGAIAACQNWRMADAELKHCLALAAPRAILCSPKYKPALARAFQDAAETLIFGEEYESALQSASNEVFSSPSQASDGLTLLYTSGTTGLPKAAVISHRAMIARMIIARLDGALFPDRQFVCWSPFFHMAATDFAFGQFMTGGAIIVMDGFNAEELIDWTRRERIGALTVLPGVVDAVLEEMRRTGAQPLGVEVVGSLPDLVAPEKIAELTRRMNAPYRNTFGSTETGLAPACKGRIPIGIAPTRFSKVQSSLCRIRLVDEDGVDVDDGEPGEVLMRGPSLFSGYWRAPEANAEAFRTGWYHMGDVLMRNPDGTLDFVDRRKYLIKSGGENIYPAEVERALMETGLFTHAVVVRQPHPRWGETPVAFVAPPRPGMSGEDVIALCRGKIAGYKLPREVLFLDAADIPLSTTGKVMRHELEARLKS